VTAFDTCGRQDLPPARENAARGCCDEGLGGLPATRGCSPRGRGQGRRFQRRLLLSREGDALPLRGGAPVGERSLERDSVPLHGRGGALEPPTIGCPGSGPGRDPSDVVGLHPLLSAPAAPHLPDPNPLAGLLPPSGSLPATRPLCAPLLPHFRRPISYPSWQPPSHFFWRNERLAQYSGDISETFFRRGPVPPVDVTLCGERRGGDSDDPGAATLAPLRWRASNDAREVDN